MKKHLWLLGLLVFPFSAWIALGYGPHWKPFLSREVSMALMVVGVIGLLWSSFRRKHPPA